MDSNARYVLDSNVIISALQFAHSKPGIAFRTALRRGQVLVSLQLLEELSEVLSREKFEAYVTAEEREDFLEALIERAELVVPTERIRACRDPKDDMVLELAVGGSATHIVTGDTDLLALNPFRDIVVLTVDALLEEMGP